jgi:hypothetical protein
MLFFDGTNQIGGVAILVDDPPPYGQIQRFSFTWTDARPGRHILTAVAIDNDGASTRSGPVEIAVAESNSLPVVNIEAIDCLAVEGTSNTAAFRVRRSGPTNAPLTVRYLIGGTASNGVDYAEIARSVTIPSGRRAARIEIVPIDDRRPERTESVVLRLVERDLPPLDYLVGRHGRAGAVIIDNDELRPVTGELADRNCHIRLPALAGLCYRLEVSDDLQNWEVHCWLNACDGGDLHFLDTDSPELKRRFFRAIEEFACPDEEE